MNQWSAQIFSTIAIAVSALSLGLSLLTLWLTRWRRGRLCMTQPTIFYFGFDSPGGIPKIYLRTLLYSTSTRGRIVHSMFLKVRSPAGDYIFDFWAHGSTGQLTRGSGLYVGPTGVSCDHHFLIRRAPEEPFHFIDGNYQIEVFASILPERPSELAKINLELPNDLFVQMTWNDAGVFFDWQVDVNKYAARIAERPE